MNIRVDTLRVAGFRGIEDLEMSLTRSTVLIGTNNSGKTSVLKALNLALGDYSRALSEEDFHISSTGERSKEIIVDVRVIPIQKNGTRSKEFDEEWKTEFGDQIKAEANQNQFVAIRTRAVFNPIKSMFETNKFVLEKWPEFKTWQKEKVKETRNAVRRESLPFFSIEAQRDIHQELREKSSFIGKVLSNVKYDTADIKALEAQIKIINDDAVSKSNDLKNLKTHLELLNQSFQGGGSAEITPFPKKIRDLSKHFSVHFGESSGSSFSMEYHGMGTRSWASMLVVKAFIGSTAKKHKEEESPYFPVVAAEEPEAHLHPNAQRTLFGQLASFNGQVVMSTHSPYLAAMASLSDLRYLKNSSGCVEVKSISIDAAGEDGRRLKREVLHSRGEILFAKGIVLCEGETEEQALPLLFQKYFGKDPFEVGVNFVGVGGSGKRYLPYLTFAKDFAIPLFIFSDGEPKIVADLKKNYDSVFGATDVEKCANITVLSGGNFESYLLSSGFKSKVEAAIVDLDGAGAVEDWMKKRQGTVSGKEKSKIPPCKTCNQEIYTEISRDYSGAGGRDLALKDILKSAKTTYAPKVAEKLCELDIKKFPPKISEFFEKIKSGLSL